MYEVFGKLALRFVGQADRGIPATKVFAGFAVRCTVDEILAKLVTANLVR